MRNLGVWILASAALSLGGCNCLQPVGELVDGGTVLDGGLDAGADAGPQPQCTTAAQCTGALPQSLCSFSSDAGYSCIDQRCVFECTKGRACAFDAGASCLDCTVPPVTACRSTGCGTMAMQGQVESSTTACTVGFTDVMLQPMGACQWSVTDATGVKGTMTHVGSGEYVGQFNGLGTCVGMSLFTQVERVLFSCEGCQFVLRI